MDTATTLASDSSISDAAKGHEYTVIALPDAGFLPSIAVIDDPFDKGLLSGSARVRGFNASANAQNLDLYLVAPGADIGAVNPTMASVAFKNAVPATTQDSIYVSGGTYQLIATLPGSKTPVYKSASFDLANNADWLVTTLPAGNALASGAEQHSRAGGARRQYATAGHRAAQHAISRPTPRSEGAATKPARATGRVFHVAAHQAKKSRRILAAGRQEIRAELTLCVVSETGLTCVLRRNS